MTTSTSTSDVADGDRLVISFDVGTTQSAVAVAYLPKGESALIDFVDRWPGQEEAMHLARVPTAILYDEEGKLVACGAEAVAAGAGNIERSRDKLAHFKMQLHPTFNTSTKPWPFRKSRKPAPLPKIYADYLSYLLWRTQSFLREATGQDVWSDLRHRAEIVFSHPNRWGAEQQKFLKEAAVQAGIVTQEGTLHFVEEAEAAASFALSKDATLDLKFENGTKFVICDAGGSTVDISAYIVTNRTPDRLDVEELDVPSCLDAGGVHVDKELAMHLYEQLVTEPEFKEMGMERVHDIVDDGLKDFQENGKQNFSLPTDSLKVDIRKRRMSYPKLQITKGIMTIEAPKADTFFSGFVGQAVDEVARRVERHQLTIIIFSGGFAQSPYFQRVVQDRWSGQNRTICFANHPASKAVAVGALKLVVGGDRSMTVVRKTRPRKMWLTNFKNGVRELLGNSSQP